MTENNKDNETFESKLNKMIDITKKIQIDFDCSDFSVSDFEELKQLHEEHIQKINEIMLRNKTCEDHWRNEYHKLIENIEDEKNNKEQQLKRNIELRKIISEKELIISAHIEANEENKKKIEKLKEEIEKLKKNKKNVLKEIHTLHSQYDDGIINDVDEFVLKLIERLRG